MNYQNLERHCLQLESIRNRVRAAVDDAIPYTLYPLEFLSGFIYHRTRGRNRLIDLTGAARSGMQALTIEQEGGRVYQLNPHTHRQYERLLGSDPENAGMCLLNGLIVFMFIDGMDSVLNPITQQHEDYITDRGLHYIEAKWQTYRQDCPAAANALSAFLSALD